VYSKIHSRLDWFFSYIGEPEEDEILLGDLNFDGQLNISDVVLVINMILQPDDVYIPEMYTAADLNEDGVINVLDVIGLVGEILGTTFAQSVNWLEENFPELKTKERLSKLDKSQYFAK
jgi:hypothetical protein